MSAPICPDCRAGKCRVCDGRAYDFDADAPTAPCRCAEAGHEPDPIIDAPMFDEPPC